MSATSTLDWTCSRCGVNDSYLVTFMPRSNGDDPPRPGTEPPPPTLDWTCARCGASQTYQLVPMAAVGR